MVPFVIGEEYSRRDDIHAVFGGQRQGGISTPSGHPYIFIFTGESGKQHGYADGWQENGVLLYTGEGQRGDMTFKAGNKAIRDHAFDGKELLLFEALGKQKPVRYLGSFSCQSWDTFNGPDSEGNNRECIQFHLVPSGEGQVEQVEAVPSAARSMSLEQLRARALAASKPEQAPQWRNAHQAYRTRSQAVRDYVLARAAGRCELTGKTAPFRTKYGEPYLEVHHTRRLSDGGPDDPRHVAAICPTVHREIHFGQHGEKLNSELVAKLKQIER
ncbi:HNH endonuclease [Mameliella alba]|uniref:HNH endonuclease n=1 Tax=Mameliella alba TaxID=561184 RepID=UPI001C94D43A|nr:HNH endonuclease signature motif containing protein [Mameliella alba]MBY6121837.1 HNH endonuclease [Mameliella alba]